MLANSTIPSQAVPFDAIIPDHEDRDVTGLMESIRRGGLHTPLVVVATEEGYLILNGFRRYAALLMLRALNEPVGRDAIPARRAFSLVPVVIRSLPL